MSKFTIEFKEGIKSGSNRLVSIMENPYKMFSASKMSLGKKTQCIVEFTDLLGKKHTIRCANRKQMLEAQSFLGMFKSESLKVKNILMEYPISFGRIPKKYMPQLRSELKEFGFTYSFINKLAGY
jgi:hypothetical protein